MLSSPTISVIVPAYNVERYVASAIDSLLHQTQPFHEIIIIDDGSTDGTAAVLEQYRRYPSVKVRYVENGGQGLARNLGLAQASGDYVYFFDSDDLLKADFVESMRSVLAGRQAIDIVYFSGESFLDAGFNSDFLPAYRRNIEMEFASGIDATGALLRNGTCFASPCLYLSRRALWSEQGLAFMPIVHEDEEIITRLSCNAGLSVCLDTVFFERRIRAQSTMTLAKSGKNTAGYRHTLTSLAMQYRRDRMRLRPIREHLVRRFYTLLMGYLSICKKIGERPHYGLLLRNVLTLGCAPSFSQVYEMSILPKVRGRLALVRNRLLNQR